MLIIESINIIEARIAMMSYPLSETKLEAITSNIAKIFNELLRNVFFIINTQL